MTKIDLLNMLSEFSKKYSTQSAESLIRNNHMNEIKNELIPRYIIDAVLVDFINYIGMKQGVDFGLYTKDIPA